MGLKKVQNKGRDENTTTLTCRRKVVAKKDLKTTLLLLPDLIFTKEQKQSSLPVLFIPSLFLYLVQAHPYLHLILTEIFLPNFMLFFWLFGSKLIKRYGSTSGNFNNSIDD